ncbi:unnamed protein product [Phytophthora fragariaefolia]|uniref:Unnamed protein product n=1 Tax=Phytophthora fragariaefolia TaxID=1490495 RepID=A0A9W7DBJ7_9STRA|nr:unnamed protein product [Phytophthora fragariaefolia]
MFNHLTTRSVLQVKSNRVAVYATEKQYVVRVLYLGDESIEALKAQDIMELSEAKIPESVMVTARGSVDSLTDTEKASAAKFYRSAVKWSIRRAHHVGMPIVGWVVNLNTMRCSCLYFKKFIFCAHIICGRAAYGLSFPGINGNNLKFKDRRVRQKRRPEPAAPLIRPPSTAIYGEMNISIVANASTYTQLLIKLTCNFDQSRFDQDARGAYSAIETLQAPQATERIMFPRTTGRPPLASHALDRQF